MDREQLVELIEGETVRLSLQAKEVMEKRELEIETFTAVEDPFSSMRDTARQMAALSPEDQATCQVLSILYSGLYAYDSYLRDGFPTDRVIERAVSEYGATLGAT